MDLYILLLQGISRLMYIGKGYLQNCWQNLQGLYLNLETLGDAT
jgi:hypothetical protein